MVRRAIVDELERLSVVDEELTDVAWTEQSFPRTSPPSQHPPHPLGTWVPGTATCSGCSQGAGHPSRRTSFVARVLDVTALWRTWGGGEDKYWAHEARRLHGRDQVDEFEGDVSDVKREAPVGFWKKTKKIEEAVQENLDWSDDNQLAEVGEMESHKGEERAHVSVKD